MRITTCLALLTLVCACDASVDTPEDITPEAVAPTGVAAAPASPQADIGAARKPTLSKPATLAAAPDFRWVERGPEAARSYHPEKLVVAGMTYQTVIFDDKGTLTATGEQTWGAVHQSSFLSKVVLLERQGTVFMLYFSFVQPKAGVFGYDAKTGEELFHTKLPTHTPSSHNTYRHELQASVIGEELHVYRNTSFGLYTEVVSATDGHHVSSHRVPDALAKLRPSTAGDFTAPTRVAGRGDGDDHSFTVGRGESAHVGEHLSLSRRSSVGDGWTVELFAEDNVIGGVESTPTAVVLTTYHHESLGAQVRGFSPKDGAELWKKGVEHASSHPKKTNKVRVRTSTLGDNVAIFGAETFGSFVEVREPTQGTLLFRYVELP